MGYAVLGRNIIYRIPWDKVYSGLIPPMLSGIFTAIRYRPWTNTLDSTRVGGQKGVASILVVTSISLTTCTSSYSVGSVPL